MIHKIKFLFVTSPLYGTICKNPLYLKCFHLADLSFALKAGWKIVKIVYGDTRFPFYMLIIFKFAVLFILFSQNSNYTFQRNSFTLLYHKRLSRQNLFYLYALHKYIMIFRHEIIFQRIPFSLKLHRHETFLSRMFDFLNHYSHLSRLYVRHVRFEPKKNKFFIFTVEGVKAYCQQHFQTFSVWNCVFIRISKIQEKPPFPKENVSFFSMGHFYFSIP